MVETLTAVNLEMGLVEWFFGLDTFTMAAVIFYTLAVIFFAVGFVYVARDFSKALDRLKDI